MTLSEACAGVHVAVSYKGCIRRACLCIEPFNLDQNSREGKYVYVWIQRNVGETGKFL